MGHYWENGKCHNCRKLSKIVKNVKKINNVKNFQNPPKLSKSVINCHKLSNIVKIVKKFQNCKQLSTLSKLVKIAQKIKILARSCFFITLIKCIKGHMSLRLLFECQVVKSLVSQSVSEWQVSDKVTYCAVLDTSVFPIHNKWRVREGGRVCTFWTVIWSSRVFPLQQTGQWWGLRGRICTF